MRIVYFDTQFDVLRVNICKLRIVNGFITFFVCMKVYVF